MVETCQLGAHFHAFVKRVALGRLLCCLAFFLPSNIADGTMCVVWKCIGFKSGFIFRRTYQNSTKKKLNQK